MKHKFEGHIGQHTIKYKLDYRTEEEIRESVNKKTQAMLEGRETEPYDEKEREYLQKEKESNNDQPNYRN